MPKIKQVKKTTTSMEWDDIALINGNRSITVSVPQRELNEFLSKGMEIESIKITFTSKK